MSVWFRKLFLISCFIVKKSSLSKMLKTSQMLGCYFYSSLFIFQFVCESTVFHPKQLYAEMFSPGLGRYFWRIANALNRQFLQSQERDVSSFKQSIARDMKRRRKKTPNLIFSKLTCPFRETGQRRTQAHFTREPQEHEVRINNIDDARICYKGKIQTIDNGLCQHAK